MNFPNKLIYAAFPKVQKSSLRYCMPILAVIGAAECLQYEQIQKSLKIQNSFACKKTSVGIFNLILNHPWMDGEHLPNNWQDQAGTGWNPCPSPPSQEGVSLIAGISSSTICPFFWSCVTKQKEKQNWKNQKEKLSTASQYLLFSLLVVWASCFLTLVFILY